jgi:mRNA interferase YafQ
MLELEVHKIFTKDLIKAKLNPTNSAKLFLYISKLLNNEELPKEAKNHFLSGEWSDTGKLFHSLSATGAGTGLISSFFSAHRCGQ